MLARVLAMTLCPAVSASVTSRSSIETAEQIELFFLHGGFLRPLLHCCKEIQISNNKGTSLPGYVPNSGLRKFRHSIWIVETCYPCGRLS